jgi:predicted nucleic acid-binding protein
VVSSDEHHRRAAEILAGCLETGTRFYTTWDVISETVTLLTCRYDSRAGVEFLDEVKPGLAIVPTTEALLKAAEAVFRREAPRRRLSFCDAISCVVVATVLRDIPMLTFDADFARLGLQTIGAR